MGAEHTCYDPTLGSGALQQGELLANIWIPVALYPPVEMPEGTDVEVDSIDHPYMFVMTPDCDLEWDYNARYPPEAQQNSAAPEENESSHKFVPYVLLCDAFTRKEIRSRFPKNLWDRIQGNHDIRYHRFKAHQFEIEGADPLEIPELYLDFKKINALPTKQFYEGVHSGGVQRIAVVTSPFNQNLVHRFFHFQSRVALPD